MLLFRPGKKHRLLRVFPNGSGIEDPKLYIARAAKECLPWGLKCFFFFDKEKNTDCLSLDLRVDLALNIHIFIVNWQTVTAVLTLLNCQLRQNSVKK